MSDDLTPAEQGRALQFAADWLGNFNDDLWWARDAQGLLLSHHSVCIPPETVESLRAERDNALAGLKASLDDVHHWQEQFRLVCDESACRLGDRNVARDKLERAEWVIRDHIAALDSMREERDKAQKQSKAWERLDIHHVSKLNAQVEEMADSRARSEAHRQSWVKACGDLGLAHETIERLRAAVPVAEAAWERCQDRPARVWKAGDPEPEGVIQVESATPGRIWTKKGTAWRNECCHMSWQHLLEDGGPLTEVLP